MGERTLSSAALNMKYELELHTAIKHAIDRSVSLTRQKIYHNVFYIVGAPGGGKTEMMKKAARDRGYGILAYTPALERVEKFGGIPDIYTAWVNRDTHEDHLDEAPQTKRHGVEAGLRHELRTEWSVPQMICEIRDAAKTHPFVIVLLDDWHLCPANIQQIGFELFTHRSLNGHPIPDNAAFILAGNEKSAAGAKVQLSAIRNRCNMLFVKPDVNYWIDEFAVPYGIHPIGLSFFTIKENHAYFHEEESTTDQYGSPRSWTSAFNTISDMEADKSFDASRSGDKKILKSMIQGCVGPKAAKQFFEYYDIYSKIPVDQIFSGKESIKVPADAVSRYAYAAAVSSKFYNLYINTSRRTKAGEAESDAYSKIFGDIMSTLYKDYPEISMRCMRYLQERPADKEAKTPGGTEIISTLVLKNLVSQEFLKKLHTLSGDIASVKSKK